MRFWFLKLTLGWFWGIIVGKYVEFTETFEFHQGKHLRTKKNFHNEKTARTNVQILVIQNGKYMGVSKNRDTSKWMVYFMENPMNKWMIWGVKTPIFWKHPYTPWSKLCFLPLKNRPGIALKRKSIIDSNHDFRSTHPSGSLVLLGSKVWLLRDLGNSLLCKM